MTDATRYDASADRAQRHLVAYLNEHLLASEGGVRALHAAARTFEGTPHERALRALAADIERDRRGLVRIIRAVGSRPAAWKRLLTGLLRHGGTINPVNLLRRRRSSMAQFELDFLSGAVRAKQSMWDALLELAGDDPRLDQALLEALQLRRPADRGVAAHQPRDGARAVGVAGARRPPRARDASAPVRECAEHRAALPPTRSFCPENS